MRALVGLATLIALGAPPAEARTLRYAIVIGNDVGTDPDLGALPPLTHAIAEAERLHQALVETCHFDGQGGRTILLRRPTRAQLTEAVRALALRMAEDRAAYGDVRTFFGFFFTGHGLAGRLLLPDGELDRRALADLFKTLAPDLSLAVIDACYSGSLDPAELREKGVRPTPGVNALAALPEELLAAEGSVWLVSSGPDEVSYEDARLGGVFTHFFTEALRAAERDGPGITLDRIWHYAQTKTLQHTLERARPQKPRKLVSRMRTSAPLYFSFPVARDGRLAFEPSVEGSFLVSYGEGAFSEIVEKPAGVAREVSVFPGPIELAVVREGALVGRERIIVPKGGRVVLSTGAPRAGLGEGGRTLAVKGLEPLAMRATLFTAAPRLRVGAEYELWVTAPAALAPTHVAGVIGRMDFGPWVGEIFGGVGVSGDRFEAWGYDAIAGVLELRAGPSLELGGDTRLGLLGTAAVDLSHQRFDDGRGRTALAGTLGVRAAVLHVLSDSFAIQPALRIGGRHGAGRAVDREGLGLLLGGGLSLLFGSFR